MMRRRALTVQPRLLWRVEILTQMAPLRQRRLKQTLLMTCGKWVGKKTIRYIQDSH